MRTPLLPWRWSDYGGLLVTFPPVYMYIPAARMIPHMLHVLNIYMYILHVYTCISILSVYLSLCIRCVLRTHCIQ